MQCYNEIPRIVLPSEQNPASATKPFLDGEETEIDGTLVTRSHYWRRIFATDIRCGDSTEVKISAKAGLSETVLKEIASSLEITVGVLKSTLSPKVSQTETSTEERAIEFTRKLAPRECRGLTFAEWQKTERISLRRTKRFLGLSFGTHERVINNRTEEFCPDYYDYPATQCCDDDIKKKIDEGFTKIVTIIFGGHTSVALAKSLPGNKIQLSGVPGSFTPGQRLQLDQFLKYFRTIGLIPTVTTGQLSNSLGSARLLFPTQPSSGQSLAGWVGLLSGIALGVGIALSRNRRSEEEELAKTQESIRAKAKEMRDRAEALMEVGRQAVRRIKERKEPAGSRTESH